AVSVTERVVGDADDVLVMAGDDPLITADQVRRLLAVHRRTRAAATILTTTAPDPTGYARVVREGNRLVELVGEDVAEDRPDVRAIHEVSTLAYAFRRDELFRALPLVTRN